MEHADLRGISYQQFIEFLFNRPVVPTPKNPGDPKPWYWDTETEFDPAEIANLFIQLFNDPLFLLDRYSDGQIEEAFWAIPNCNLNCSVGNLIWDPRLPIEKREEIIRSMFSLFEKLFAVNSFESSVGMWWDALAYDWHCGNRIRERGREDLWVQDVMFETLKKIAFLPTKAVQEAALHGFGHLHHPDTEEFIEGWLGSQKGLDPETIEYARAAAKFKVQ